MRRFEISQHRFIYALARFWIKDMSELSAVCDANRTARFSAEDERDYLKRIRPAEPHNPDASTTGRSRYGSDSVITEHLVPGSEFRVPGSPNSGSPAP